MPIISVVVPAYNSQSTILETIDSVLGQTFSDFELIVINDGSTDNTLEILTSVKDTRLKVYSYPNGGLPAARNRGIARASGEFISFIDADDLWTPDKLELQIQALQKNPSAGVAYSWTICMGNNGESFHPGVSESYQGNVYANLLVGNFIASGSNVLLRKETIESAGYFDESLKSSEDWDYWLRLAPKWDFVVVPKPQIIYRLSSGAMSSNLDVMEKYQTLVLKRAFELAPAQLHHLKNRGFAYIYLFMTRLYLSRANNAKVLKQATQKLWKAIRLSPNILMSKEALLLIIKVTLLRIISPKIAANILSKTIRVRKAADPRLQAN
ncbi:glycosyl transferase [Rivularia sp. PCC 7116]|uniref:glycosyltransferase family 2 protein n=1 Tax=Rivularia sp. PCC 7116 TaxID=373994 RepID=UPI00029EE6D0|nr:glycosyltransferase [Rivularia sp. PCC 7116]AFY58142.1 glycosyl transferase [Rivularia sp. PCC 7116]